MSGIVIMILKFMSWTTIYVTGKEGFNEEVLKHLMQADFEVMPGSSGKEPKVSLYWVDESVSLRDFKKAIGAKIVFKYRLQFFSTLEEIENAQALNSKLTAREEAMIREMINWESHQMKSA
jgi:hypothetical protein